MMYSLGKRPFNRAGTIYHPPCPTLVTLPPGTANDMTLLSGPVEDVALPPCSVGDVTRLPNSIEDVCLLPCPAKDVALLSCLVWVRSPTTLPHKGCHCRSRPRHRCHSISLLHNQCHYVPVSVCLPTLLRTFLCFFAQLRMLFINLWLKRYPE